MEDLIEIGKYADSYYGSFKDMFREYFVYDLGLELPGDRLETICREITDRVETNVIFLDLLTCNGIGNGFIIYQVDSPQSDWCEKEGYGFIRELFIAANRRKQGLGKLLVAHAESKLRDLAVQNIYLTTDENDDFWIKMGYRDSGEISAINNIPVFVK